ncbi:chemotaxis protein CheA, partial [Thalassospira xiamenensis]
MSFDVDEDILQDFLIEAGEILEQLSEQLVELENNPDNQDLLNAIFRGFHTVKGGAGFLSLTALVDTCHGAENVFDTLRNHQRKVTSELMDVILQALDTINAQFSATQSRTEPEPASPELLAALDRLAKPESEDEAPVEVPVASEPEATPEETAADEPASDGGVDEITEDEFEAMLDELHGGQPTGKKTAAKKAPAAAKPAAKDEASGGDDEITDDEFEALLDQLHGDKAPNQAAPEANKASKKDAGKPAADANDSDEIDDDEFEALLDQIHGKGAAPKKETTPAVAKAAEQPAAKPAATPASKPAEKAADKPAAAEKAPAAPAAPPPETTVRVDTKRLDQIMNMVGELVLVRNRLLSLSVNNEDEEMSKAIANLDVVTGDLQGAVMKTRMQPIKKVFGRFPRVVRDLARSLKKDINLELIGEETDLDKNLV